MIYIKRDREFEDEFFSYFDNLKKPSKVRILKILNKKDKGGNLI